MGKIYIWTYHNPEDFCNRLKIHLTDNFEKGLCGFIDRRGIYAGVLTGLTCDWLNQPDPDGMLCKKCKKIALKRLQSKNS